LIAIAIFAPSGWFRDAATSFLGNLAATLSVLIVIYVFYIYVTPPGLREATLIPLGNAEISNEIVDRVTDATDYWFWGRSGSYFRSEVLPRLDQAAREARRHVRIRVVLPDFGSTGNGVFYMNLLRGLGETADRTTLGAGVMATIVAVARCASLNPYLHAEIGLCATVPVLRFDISNFGALITRDSKKLPGVLINSGNAYFDMAKDAVEAELLQSQKISWVASAIAECGPDEVSRQLLNAIEGLPACDDQLVECAKSMLQSGRHRYA
jgi:hypothetical protein